MNNDQELEAMRTVLSSLEKLEPDEQSRVIDWVTQKLSIARVASKPKDRSDAQTFRRDDPRAFSEFHDLFDATVPKTESDRALVGGYWLQVCSERPDFTGQEVNDQLKQLGHPASNITRAFDFLQEQKPVLARQIQKTGKAKQGRKKYKLTREGQTRVEEMYRGGLTEG